MAPDNRAAVTHHSAQATLAFALYQDELLAGNKNHPKGNSIPNALLRQRTCPRGDGLGDVEQPDCSCDAYVPFATMLSARLLRDLQSAAGASKQPDRAPWAQSRGSLPVGHLGE